MSIKWKTSLFLIFFGILVFLSGCFNQETPEQHIYEGLENVVSLEKPFVDQQESLIQLEKQEKELYDEIMGIGMKEHEQIMKLSDEAIALNEQRQEHIEIERNSIVASEKEFKALQPMIEKIEDEKTKEKAVELYDIMMNRYQSHEALHRYYLDGLQLDIELYSMLKQEDLTLDELEEQIMKINEMYEKVIEENKRFNEQTEKFNQMKLSFYNLAGFNVEVEE